jgi:hypothetical protein
MTFDGLIWTLNRSAPDSTALEFAQRFTGTLAARGATITAGWESSDDGEHWRTDFDLSSTRIPATSGPPAAHERNDAP